MDYRSRLLALYDLLPFHEHPLWKAVIKHDLSLDEILKAEVQHYLRTKSGQSLRGQALEKAKGLSDKLFEALLETYLEECTNETASPNHLDLIKRLLVLGGLSEFNLDTTQLTPGNAAAIALYKDISSRGAACHMLGAGVVEFYYSTLAPKIYIAYTGKYGMTPEQAETYSIHGPMDQTHAERAFNVLDEAIRLNGWDIVEQSVRDAFVATSLHYDGMLQAAFGKIVYWNGRSE